MKTTIFFMNDLVFVQFVSTYKWINLKAPVSLLCNKLWDSQMISVYTIYLFKIELFGLAMKKKPTQKYTLHLVIWRLI